MQFIEALKLKSKLFFLFMLIALGLITVAILGTMHINAMKKNIDGVYFGSLVPVIELNEIIHTYNNELSNAIYKSVRNELSPEEALLQIRHALKEIDKIYLEYMSHFKRESEIEYAEYVAAEIEATKNYFLKIHTEVLQGRELKKLNLNLLEKKVSSINLVMQKLIKYEVDVARYERKHFLQSYNSTMKQLGVFLTLILFAVLAISYSVFRSIQKDHTSLQVTTSKLKKANKKLENLSYTDVLTGLHNRRYFNYIYERELRRAKRSKSFVTFMMLDVDYFKQYNDTYGHLEGDAALKSVAKVLKEKLKRPSDFIFRLGGEEFGILLMDTDESNSARIAQELCDNLRLHEIPHEGSKISSFLTISIGAVCCIADESLDNEVLLSRADEILYRAKEAGRDRYFITTDVSAARVEGREEELIA
jgi:diguanylate cyclase (GGDEF)-like protein